MWDSYNNHNNNNTTSFSLPCGNNSSKASAVVSVPITQINSGLTLMQFLGQRRGMRSLEIYPRHAMPCHASTNNSVYSMRTSPTIHRLSYIPRRTRIFNRIMAHRLVANTDMLITVQTTFFQKGAIRLG